MKSTRAASDCSASKVGKGTSSYTVMFLTVCPQMKIRGEDLAYYRDRGEGISTIVNHGQHYLCRWRKLFRTAVMRAEYGHSRL